MRVITLSSSDPYANLAAERHIFENAIFGEKALLLYVNRPCVVVGRSQNPWRECNLFRMAGLGLPLVRRYTGGGTVYHDPGNLNFAFISPRESYDKTRNAELVASALAGLGIEAAVNERNDLTVCERKFSGSAYRLTKERALHHGTILVDADLAALRSVLKPSFPGIESRGVASVSSPVIALSELIPGLEISAIEDALAAEVGGVRESLSAEDLVYRESAAAADAFRGWEWRFGKTPRFSFPLPGRNDGSARLQVEHGRLSGIEGAAAAESAEEWRGHIGKKLDQIGNLSLLQID